jgi:hypothetical protein
MKKRFAAALALRCASASRRASTSLSGVANATRLPLTPRGSREGTRRYTNPKALPAHLCSIASSRGHARKARVLRDGRV